MNDKHKEVFNDTLDMFRTIAERVFNRKLSESALAREHNAMIIKLKGLEIRSTNAAIERGALLTMISGIKKSEPEPEPEPVSQEFKPGEVVMVQDEDGTKWYADILKRIHYDGTTKYECDSDYWDKCRKLNDEEKGL